MSNVARASGLRFIFVKWDNAPGDEIVFAEQGFDSVVARWVSCVSGEGRSEEQGGEKELNFHGVVGNEIRLFVNFRSQS